MAAGKRNRYVLIEKSTETQSVGEPTVTWSTHATWWAERTPLGGSESIAVGQTAYATRRHRWEGLYIAGVHEGMRLNEGGVLYDIDVADEDYRDNLLIVVTTRRDTV